MSHAVQGHPRLMGHSSGADKTKIMASSLITFNRRENSGNNDRFCFLGLCFYWLWITNADVDCSNEIERCLLLGRKAVTNLASLLKCIDITLLTMICTVRAMVFPVVMYGCESWTIKKTEHWRNDAFKLWCWRRLLRVPWAARRSN